jgi:DNA-binding NarL/FixJ family response regulator
MLLVAQVDNAVSGLAEFRRLRPDVTLMDLRLPGMSGTEALRSIRSDFPNARIIALTSVDADGEIQHALKAGAAGYILKNMSGDEILTVIRAVHQGVHRRLPSEVAVRLAEHFGQEDLTERELDVLKLIRDGNRTKQIADRLAISESTVNFHLKNLIDKLGANDRSHALAIAIRRGLLQA